MPLLVEGLCPQLTPYVISQCKNIGIQTVAAFISTNTEELAKKTKVAYKDLICARRVLLAKYAGFSVRGDSLYSMLLETINIISSGSKRVDRFLKGGIYTGEVTEIHGPPGSGKTQFFLSVTANLVLDSENTVLYLDTNNNFVAGRIEQILSKKCEDKTVLYEKLQRIRVVNVRDIYHMFAVLDYIKSELSKKENEFFVHLKLVVLDSITHLLSPCFGGKYLNGTSFMSNAAQLFKIICSQHVVSILVSNNTVWSETCDIKAGLGPSWKYVPSVSLCIRKLNETKLRKLTTVKSCRNGLHNEILLTLNDSGITD